YTGAEGITWVKTSPGGKLNNISGGFSGYSVTPPSPQVAVRENALHHFSTVTVTGSDLEVVTYGVVGDGSPAVVVDRFHYQETCAPELSFAVQPVLLDVDEQSAQTLGVTVSVADPAVAWSTDVPWLSVVADSEPGNALVSLDAAQLAVGTHLTSVRAELAGYDPATLLIVARVGTPLPTGELVAFSGPARSSSGTLDGAVLASLSYLGLVPDGPLVNVAFALDGRALRDEDSAPFDVVGDQNGARPLELDDGPHTLEAILTAPSGATNTLVASFTVASPAVAGDCVAEPCTTVPPTVPPTVAAADAPPASATATPATPISAGLSTLAPAVDRTNHSSSATGGDWWARWPALMLAVVVVGLFVGLLTRPRSHRAHSAGAS
ncbi:MAG TPA: hypothetical protein VMM60_06815, partial [Ilumatobacter sp.]|nr:hypothetical protein [Ilumatobacter sp.]